MKPSNETLDQNIGKFTIMFDDLTKRYLLSTSKWSFGLSIIGFILALLMVIASIYMFIAFSNMKAYGRSPTMSIDWFAMCFYLAFAILFFMPSLFLFKFSTKIKSSLKLGNQEDFIGSFINLKRCFKFLTLMIIVLFVLYILAAFYMFASGSTTLFG